MNVRRDHRVRHHRLRRRPFVVDDACLDVDLLVGAAVAVVIVEAV